jgi:hypothetical protein
MQERAVAMWSIECIGMKTEVDGSAALNPFQSPSRVPRLRVQEIRNGRTGHERQLFFVLFQVGLIIVTGYDDCSRCFAGMERGQRD